MVVVVGALKGIPHNMAICEFCITPGSTKVRFLIKIDIEKPIPPSAPIPIINRQVILSGNLHTSALIAAKLKMNIPRGLPITSPATIPIVLLSITIKNEPGDATTHVFARAKIGRIMI